MLGFRWNHTHTAFIDFLMWSFFVLRSQRPTLPNRIRGEGVYNITLRREGRGYIFLYLLPPSPWISVIMVKQRENLPEMWPPSFFLTHFNRPFSREITNSPMGVIVGNQGRGRAFCLSVHSVSAPLLLHPESSSHNTEEWQTWQTTDSIKSTDFQRNWIYFLWHVLFATLHRSGRPRRVDLLSICLVSGLDDFFQTGGRWQIH